MWRLIVMVLVTAFWVGCTGSDQASIQASPSYPTPSASPTAAALVIDCIFFDGVVFRSEADEYVRIGNIGTTTVNLDGWRLTDIADGSPTIVFPSFLLNPGQRIRVYTNEFHPEWGGFSFGFGRAVWNNSDPDVAALFNDDGVMVSTASYPPGC